MTRILLALLLFSSPAFAAEAPFKRGVNLTNWLQSSGPRAVHFTKFTREDLQHIADLGADVIRLPINLHAMSSGAPNYQLDPLLLFFLDQIIDWSEELGLHLILDNHTFDVNASTDPQVGQILIPVWTQMAAHFKDRSDLVYYEILNEPHGIADATWNAIQQKVVAAIRTVDERHTIIVGPAGWNSFRNLELMPEYADDNLIYTFHFYEPFLFTHQGASWVTPSMVPLADVPFPYDSERMPAVPASLVGSWIGSAFSNYASEGTAAYIEEQLDIAARFAQERDVPVFCGEMGVYMPNSPNEDRIRWYRLVRDGLEARGLSWTSWDYKGGFGLFERGSDELFDYDLNIPLLRALGLNTPPQQEFVLRPTEEGFEFYGDFVGAQMAAFNWTTGGTVDYYSEANPARGQYALRWSGGDRYGLVGFDLAPNRDLSLLPDRGYALGLWVRGDTPGSAFDIRFVNGSDTTTGQLPWRIRYTIDEDDAAWDNEWHKLHLPLQQFEEQGAWDGEWHPAEGLFDWSAIDRMEIVAEYHDFNGRTFFFDDIRLVSGESTAVIFDAQQTPVSFALEANYPNPFNSSTVITYQMAASAQVQIAVYNIAGQKVRTLVDAARDAGRHTLVWDGLDEAGQSAASGQYFYRMLTSDFFAAGKMMLLR